MLNQHEVVPPLTARTLSGDPVHAWDFKQKKNLVIAFLHAGCATCNNFLGELSSRAKDLAECEAMVLAVYSKFPWVAEPPKLPPEILATTDTTGCSQHAYFEEDVLRPTGQRGVGVFVTDRYGELHAQWAGREPESLPHTDEILDWLRQIELACEEDGVSHWTVGV